MTPFAVENYFSINETSNCFIIFINNNFWMNSVILYYSRILYKKRYVLEVTTFEGFIVHEFCCSRSDLEVRLSALLNNFCITLLN